jgi:hypothetical protein
MIRRYDQVDTSVQRMWVELRCGQAENDECFVETVKVVSLGIIVGLSV